MDKLYLEIMDKIPSEIINLILEYQGYHSNRNGKYICKLNLDSEKYDLLKKIPIVQLHNDMYKTSFTIMKTLYSYHYTIFTYICNDKVHWCMELTIVPLDKNSCIAHRYNYIYDQNIKKHLPSITY